MNRLEIKTKARELINGNMLTILTPFLIVNIALFIIEYIVINAYGDSSTSKLLMNLIGIAALPLQIGIFSYLLKFTRKEQFHWKDIFNYYKYFIFVFGLYFLMGIFTFFWAILLIIPGIIAAISYTMAPYLMADGSKDPFDCIRKSKKMMFGYKWDYFVFNLSFIGWFLLSILTFGVLLIYAVPYIAIANILYYEELKKITNLD